MRELIKTKEEENKKGKARSVRSAKPSLKPDKKDKVERAQSPKNKTKLELKDKPASKVDKLNKTVKHSESKKIKFGKEKDNKSQIFKKLKEYGEKQFEEKVSKDDISSKRKDFDDFFMSAYKLILSKLNNEDFENDISYTNFYSNVCEPLYQKDDDENKLITLMKFLFEKNAYQDMKKEYKIKSEDIDALLYGYRYCLNEVKDKEGNYIYSYLYNRSNLNDFDQKFYPGNDNNKDEPYYELYNKIINHFKEKPDEGCYVCLCDKGFYHSVPSGFPDFKEINMKCPKCQNEIGAKEFYIKETDEKDENKTILIKKYETTENNSNYYRIFKDKEQIKDLKRMKEYYSKFEKLKYMTVEEFKEQYINPLYSKEKGLNKIDINNFKKENKVVRNLNSNISDDMIRGIANDIKQLKDYNHTLNDLLKESDDNEVANNNTYNNNFYGIKTENENDENLKNKKNNFENDFQYNDDFQNESGNNFQKDFILEHKETSKHDNTRLNNSLK